MGRRSNIEWLLSELPELTANGVLSPDAADRVRLYYEQQSGKRRSWLGPILSAVGALLIGGGVISLLAYNWDHLSRATRALIAFVPLVVGQLGGSWTLLKANGRCVGAREGWAAFWALAVGACLGLIAQTYHLGGRFDTFLLVWMLLALPIAFVLQAVTPALLAMIGFTAWEFMWIGYGGSGLWLWPLGLLSVAAAWPVLLRKEDAPRAALVTTFAAMMFLISVGFTSNELGQSHFEKGWPFLFFVGAGAALQVLGECTQDSPRWSLFLVPGRIGSFVVWFLSLVLTYAGVWREFKIVTWANWLSMIMAAEPVARVVSLIVLLAIAGTVAMGLAAAARKRQWATFGLGSAPVVLAIAMTLDRPLAAPALMNAYMLAASVAGIVFGIRERKARRAYTGLATLMLLIGLRFFDIDIGFVARGVVFILLGTAFLVAQRILARYMREAS